MPELGTYKEATKTLSKQYFFFIYISNFISLKLTLTKLKKNRVLSIKELNITVFRKANLWAPTFLMTTHRALVLAPV